MSVEFIMNYINIEDDMDMVTKIKAGNRNDTIDTLRRSLESSKILEKDPNDGRIAIITLTAQLEGEPLSINTKYVFPEVP